jgi:hypothetical protein
MMKPLAVVLAFEQDAIPPTRLSDEIAARFADLIKLPPIQRRAEIDKIWDKYKERK